MISDELQERVAKAWFETIPLAYRWRSDDHTSNHPAASAIIAAPPPKSLVNQFFAIVYQITAGNEFSIIKVEAKRGNKRVRLAA